VKEEFYSPTFNFLSLSSPDSINKLESNFKRHMAGEEIDPYEYALITKDGKRIEAIITTKLIDYEGERAILGIVTEITDIRKVQDALMKSESKYRQLIELAQEGVWALDNNLVTVFVNPRMAQMLGYSEGEIVGRSLYEFLDKDVIEQAKDFLVQFKRGIIGRFDYAFPRKDGTHVYTSIVASNITDDEGQLVGTLALVSDTTERKQTEEALKESEERYRAIVTHSPIGIATSDVNKHFLSANNAFCRILGYEENELRKLTFRDITYPEDARESIKKMEELEAGRISSFTLEKRYVKKDRSLINGKIMVSAIRDQDGKPKLFIAELEDISERKKKELELKAERNKLEAITQSIGAGFVVIGKDYRVQWANKFIKEYKGDIEGKLCYATLNDLSNVCPDCGVKKIFENGANFDAHEYESIDIKGKPYWVEIIATPIRDEAGNVVSAIEIAVDITEKKNLQRELAEYSENLEKTVDERTEQLKQTQAKLVKSERLAAIGELAGMVGHDLRNPLAGMRSALYYLNKHCGTKLTVTELKMLQIIDDCVYHSDKIVNDLLDYSREIKLEAKKTTVRELVRSSLKSLDIPITVQVADTTESESLTVDVAKMNRVFINLFKNGFEAMPDGGRLQITSRTLADEIEIKVTDTGGGMSTETLDKIWTPLFTTKAKGMGFGLAVCKRLVEAHGGRINVKSEIGKGTTFTIIIPKQLVNTDKT